MRYLPRNKTLYFEDITCNSTGLLSDWKEFNIYILSDFFIQSNREYVLK